MPRIVAGLAKGRRLATPASGTRPTSDRAREALFNSLATMLELDGARVADLFAGTGAVGLEALSRGARSAVFVESDQRACEVLRRNVAAVALPGAVVRRRAVGRYLSDAASSEADAAGPSAPDAPFDLVFADPPYTLAQDVLTGLLAQLGPLLAEDAVVVVERSARDAAPVWPDEIDQLRDRRYGEGVLWYGRRR